MARPGAEAEAEAIVRKEGRPRGAPGGAAAGGAAVPAPPPGTLGTAWRADLEEVGRARLERWGREPCAVHAAYASLV